ncbi:MAG: pyruvate kinase [Desulfurococcaceae archaeon]
MARTKILATIGPSSASYEIVKKMMKRGVAGFRINCAHGEPALWNEYFKIVRDVSSELDVTVSTIIDVPGPQIRSGDFNKFEVKKGDVVKLIYSFKEESEKHIPIPVKEFFTTVSHGDVVLYGDGELLLRIVNIDENIVEAMALNDAVVNPRKKLVIQGKDIEISFPSERDKSILEYATSIKASYVALSYVRTPGDVLLARDFMARTGWVPGIISKIETRGSIQHIEGIISSSDGILIARGDLGLHLPLENLPILQREIINKAMRAGKPTIIATEILESMISSPRPSRSDVVDIYNIVHQLADAILLTNETAIGKYPVETVEWAKKIIETAENSIPNAIIEESRRHIIINSLREKYVQGLILFAESIGGIIVGYTKTGRLPLLISKLRPQVSIYIGSTQKQVLERLSIYYGISLIDLSRYGHDDIEYEDGVEMVFNVLKTKGLIKPGDIVVRSYTKYQQDIHEIRVEKIY